MALHVSAEKGFHAFTDSIQVCVHVSLCVCMRNIMDRVRRVI